MGGGGGLKHGDGDVDLAAGFTDKRGGRDDVRMVGIGRARVKLGYRDAPVAKNVKNK